MNPLDLPGPAFLALWLGGAGLVGVVTAIAIAVVRGRASPDEAEAIAAALDPAELAALAGGIERAVETSVVALHHRGALRVTSAGLALGTPAGQVSALQRHVLDQVGAGITEIADIVASADAHRWALDQQLRSHGLLAGGSKHAVRAAAYAWMLLGIAKLGVGIARDRPIGFLMMLLILGAWLTALIVVPRRSALGDAVLAVRADRAAGLGETAAAAPALLTSDELELAVAVFGAAGVTTAVTAMLPSHARAVAAATSASSASCGSSCSSCGGGCGGCS